MDGTLKLLLTAAVILAGLFPDKVSAVSDTVSGPRYLAHVAQGQRWETRLHVINTCSEAKPYWIHFSSSDGDSKRFAFSATDPEKRSSSIFRPAEEALPGKSIESFVLPDTGDELLQGYGQLSGDDCIGVDIEYRQTLPTGEVLFSTVPHQRRAVDDLILSLSGSTCDIGVAIAGTGGTVQVDAVQGDGSTVGSVSFGNLYHAAFSANARIPGADRAESLHIKGAAAALGLEFCQGKLAQFRLPHPHPPASFGEVWGVRVKPLSDASFSHQQFSLQLSIWNPTAMEKTYRATIQLKDSEGFLLTEGFLAKYFFVPANQIRTFHQTFSVIYPKGYDDSDVARYDAAIEEVHID